MRWQDSDWEEVDADDAVIDKDLVHAATATSFGRSSHEHLAAMAKVFEVFLLFISFQSSLVHIAVPPF